MAWPKPRPASNTSTPPWSATSSQRLVGHQQAGLQQADIVGQHADAVAVVAGEVGGDQMLGDVARLGLAAAHGAGGEEDEIGQRAAGMVGMSWRPDCGGALRGRTSLLPEQPPGEKCPALSPAGRAPGGRRGRRRWRRPWRPAAAG